MNTLRRLHSDDKATMAIETAVVAPILILMGLGSFQVSDMVARQHLLQSTAAEAEQIIIATEPDSQNKLDTIETVLSTSSGLEASKVTITFAYRCGVVSTLVANSGTCGSSPEWTFARIILTDTYTPVWTAFGVGSSVALRVDRTVQLS